MKNGRQSAYNQGYDEGFDEAKKEYHLKKGKERAATPDAEWEKLKARVVQLEHEKAEITSENKWLQRRVDDLLISGRPPCYYNVNHPSPTMR
jgi:hypothetical protein